MASIEVSLAGSRRRSAGARDVTRELDALRSALTDKDSLIQKSVILFILIQYYQNKEKSISNFLNSSRLYKLHSLKKQLSASLSAARLAAQAASPTASRASSHEEASPALSVDERKALEERANAVKADLDARKTNIQELRRRLEKTHVTE